MTSYRKMPTPKIPEGELPGPKYPKMPAPKLPEGELPGPKYPKMPKPPKEFSRKAQGSAEKP